MSGVPRTELTKREIAMAAAYRASKTLVEIGTEYGITRERVRQILTRRFGIRAKQGGVHLRTRQRQITAAARRDERSLARWGCTFAQYCELRAMRRPTRAWSQQRKNAHSRGVSWELNLWQWWTIWKESGHWEQRGRGNGFVMCRRGDVGPYSIENVTIERGNVNSSEGQSRKRKTTLPIGVRKSGKLNYAAARKVGGETLRLGIFATPEAAHAAYLAADPLRVSV